MRVAFGQLHESCVQTVERSTHLFSGLLLSLHSLSLLSCAVFRMSGFVGYYCMISAACGDPPWHRVGLLPCLQCRCYFLDKVSGSDISLVSHALANSSKGHHSLGLCCHNNDCDNFDPSCGLCNQNYVLYCIS